jgi:predicted metalloendopeptidase
MNDNFYYFQTSVRESAQTARLLEEKITQLIDIIDFKNNVIETLNEAIKLHQNESHIADISNDEEKVHEANSKLWELINLP